MGKTFDVVALGEFLIDFTCNGVSPQGNPMYEANPGGAPCNVLAMLAKLGKRTAFVGKVGGDQFGALLRGPGGPHHPGLRQDGGERGPGLLLLPGPRRRHPSDCR